MDTYATIVAGKPEPETERLLYMNEVLRLTGLSRTTLYQRIARGEFPKQRKVGPKSAWLQSEITVWMRKLPEGEP